MSVWLSSLFFLLFTLAPALLLRIYTTRLAEGNVRRRRAILSALGVPESDQTRHTLVGFFHPYCNAGGGGERVLWTAVALLQCTDPHIVSVVYSGDGAAGKEEIISKVKSRFNISLDPTKLHFVFLRSRYLVEDASWRHLTLLGQSLGSMYLAWEALTQLMPDLYIDTMGYAFTFPVVRIVSAGRVPVGAYVHYPTISTDMLARVRARRGNYANAQRISGSAVLSFAKLLYYRIFMYTYACTLRCASFLMVNSTWTKFHINSLLAHQDAPLDALSSILDIFVLLSQHILKLPTNYDRPSSAKIVYPPCETQELVDFPLEGREKLILSVAQFRPEKDHAAQLHALAELFKTHPEHRKDIRLIMVGGCRNAEDEARVEGLRALAKDLSVSENIEFVLNAPHSEVLSWLSRASIGISTMVDEHFGINVVEFMAAGVIPVVHASAGPLIDIVVPYKGEPTGYHATTPETFSTALHTALSLSPSEDFAMRKRARTLALERFSRRGFEQAWEESGWRRWLPSSTHSAS
ncbi:ALG11 [Sanghuangporus vaninii]